MVHLQLLPATSACWNLHLKLEEHCSDCQEWLTLVIFLHKWHSSDSPKHTFRGQNVINTHSMPKDVGMIRKANQKNQIFWNRHSERSKALKIYLDSLFSCSCITPLLASCCEQGSDSHWKPHTDIATTPVHQSHPFNPAMDQRDTLKTFSPTVRLLCEQFLVSQLGWQWLLRCPSWSTCISLMLQEHQQQERWVWCSVPLVSKNHLYHMDERQHNPQLESAWCSELQWMQFIKFQSCASLHKLTRQGSHLEGVTKCWAIKHETSRKVQEREKKWLHKKIHPGVEIHKICVLIITQPSDPRYKNSKSEITVHKIKIETTLPHLYNVH